MIKVRTSTYANQYLTHRVIGDRLTGADNFSICSSKYLSIEIEPEEEDKNYSPAYGGISSGRHLTYHYSGALGGWGHKEDPE